MQRFKTVLLHSTFLSYPFWGIQLLDEVPEIEVRPF
jgi:hypothetical protein